MASENSQGIMRTHCLHQPKSADQYAQEQQLAVRLARLDAPSLPTVAQIYLIADGPRWHQAEFASTMVWMLAEPTLQQGPIAQLLVPAAHV